MERYRQVRSGEVATNGGGRREEEEEEEFIFHIITNNMQCNYYKLI